MGDRAVKLSESARRNAVTLLKSITLLLVLALIGYLSLEHYDLWSIAEVNQHLGAAIPMDAFNINIGGDKRLNPSLVLNFDVPTESASQYGKQVCGGKLYQRYDPFNATDVDMPSRHAYPITLYGHTYYSFSTLATDDDWGNRCESLDGTGYVQIISDRSDPTLYHMKAQYFFSCDAVCHATS